MRQSQGHLRKTRAIVYVRVSTERQDVDTQIRMGKALAKELGYEDEAILVISDHGVSARKKAMTERNGLNAALAEIEKGDVGHFIVRDRDRVARNMIEHLQLYKRIRKHDTVFCLSDPAATPISNKYGEEAYFALQAEIDGNNIANRTAKAARFYLPAPLGLRKEGKKGKTRYVHTDQIEVVKDLFVSFNLIQSTNEYQAFRRRWKQKIGKYPDSILTHGLYAATMIDGDMMIRQDNVEPIVDLSVILDNRAKLNAWGYPVRSAKKPRHAMPRLVTVPCWCVDCQVELQTVTRGDHRTFRCPTCKVKVSESVVHNILLQTVSELVDGLDPEKLRTLTEMKIVQQRRLERRRHNQLQRQQSDLRRQILQLPSRNMGALLEKNREITVEISRIEERIATLDEILTDVEQLRVLLINRINQWVALHSETLEYLLIDHVGIRKDALFVYHRFGNFIS